jgi:hypothetical protein
MERRKCDRRSGNRDLCLNVILLFGGFGLEVPQEIQRCIHVSIVDTDCLSICLGVYLNGMP